MTYHAKVIAGGKIVIPADLRREFGIKDGDTLILEKDEEGGLSIMTFEQSVRDSQRRARAIFGESYSIDQFLRERRADWGEE
ncbi:AbrB family looped-hinge helix DNA binding protein [Sphingomonas sp. BE138]|uniref:AbrB/MazE/SpoVT family DNA-binding domain-containing protein n=1 Tax=Sphingomonas sp. BE138 TaxID=2817845 RepID=UPI002861F516|nr:AbrB/MazE/SpoVT family DNA-binding domain-containing protein [Sphingomonas sp. BE138]MDR6788946.1 AbrB family looped-hinge helix DNA binding protein [Sphingomonas sp. BE138]